MSRTIHRTVAILASAVFALPTVALSAPAKSGNASPRNVADQAVQSISRGEIRSVAETMHYPPQYTVEERGRDIASTGDGMSLMAGEFGAVTGVKLHAGAAVFYEVGGSGGDVRYLSSLHPKESGQFLYDATFAKRGAGYIRLTVIRLTAGSPYEVLGVYFGLPASDARSAPAILEVTRKQLIEMKVPITPEMARQMKASLRPVKYPS